MSTKVIPDLDIRDAILEAGGTDAYKCYQCGTCMTVCPWYRLDAVLFPVYRTPQSVKFGAIMASEDAAAIEREVAEVYRCVGCESCAAWCPHGVSLPDIMRAIRRILVQFGSYPSELKEAVSRVQSSGNPFGEPRERRTGWADGLEVRGFEPDMEYLFAPCCVPAYDPRAQRVARAAVQVLRAAEVSFGVMPAGEACCGESIRRAGAEEVFQQVASANIEAFAGAGARTVMTVSPHCYATMRQEYRQLGAGFDVVHQTQLFHRLLREERLQPRNALPRRVVYHDPCTLGRLSGVFDEPREVLASIPRLVLLEIPDFSRDHSVCCGGGSGGVWMERPKGERLSDLRVQQAVDAGAEILAVACPYCLQMFSDSVTTMGLELEVKDVAELLADAL